MTISEETDHDDATTGVPEGRRRAPARAAAGARADARRSARSERPARWSSSAAATAARRRPSTCDMWSNGTIDITLVEADAGVRLAARCRISCWAAASRSPTSPCSYDGLAKRGRQGACATRRRRSTRSAGTVRISRAAATFAYDRLVLSPGVDFLYRRRCRGLGSADAQAQGAARVEGRAADGRAAPAARGDARRRRVRDLDPDGAVPLPAGTVRARLPGRVVLQAREAAQQGADPRRQRGRHVEEGPVQEGLERGLQGHRRVPAELRADRRRRRDADREVRDRRRRQGRRAERDPAAARRRHRARRPA